MLDFFQMYECQYLAPISYYVATPMAQHILEPPLALYDKSGIPE